jgi:short-subunit dehydrogenase
MSTIIITGASMGIGRALALAWAERGATLVLSARGKDVLQDVAREAEAKGGRAIAVAGDVTDEGHRVELVERAVREGGSLDVLVNNAGRGYYAEALNIEVDAMRDLFELNVFAPLRLTQIAAPHLEATRGTVVMMSSIAGVIASPKYAAYSGSKFALEAVASSMRAEVAERGIRVVVIRPGPVRTAFRARSLHVEGEAGAARPSIRSAIPFLKERTERDDPRSPDPNAQSAEDVAAMTLDAVDRGTPVVETSAYVRYSSAVARIAPPVLRTVLKRMAR